MLVSGCIVNFAGVPEQTVVLGGTYAGKQNRTKD